MKFPYQKKTNPYSIFKTISNFLLQENESFLLQENGHKIKLEHRDRPYLSKTNPYRKIVKN